MEVSKSITWPGWTTSRVGDGSHDPASHRATSGRAPDHRATPASGDRRRGPRRALPRVRQSGVLGRPTGRPTLPDVRSRQVAAVAPASGQSGADSTVLQRKWQTVSTKPPLKPRHPQKKKKKPREWPPRWARLPYLKTLRRLSVPAAEIVEEPLERAGHPLPARPTSSTITNPLFSEN